MKKSPKTLSTLYGKIAKSGQTFMAIHKFQLIQSPFSRSKAQMKDPIYQKSSMEFKKNILACSK
jgi:hypothetical protein